MSNADQRSGLSVWTSYVFSLWFVFLFGEGCSPAVPTLRWVLFSAPAVLSTSNGVAYSIRYAPSWLSDQGCFLPFCIALSCSLSLFPNGAGMLLPPPQRAAQHLLSPHLPLLSPPLSAALSSTCGATLPPRAFFGFAAPFHWMVAVSDLPAIPLVRDGVIHDGVRY